MPPQARPLPDREASTSTAPPPVASGSRLKRRAAPPPPLDPAPIPIPPRRLSRSARSAKPSHSPPLSPDAHRLLIMGPPRRGSTGEKEATIVEKGLSAIGLQLRRSSLAAMGVLVSTSSVITTSKESPLVWGENPFAKDYFAASTENENLDESPLSPSSFIRTPEVFPTTLTFLSDSTSLASTSLPRRPSAISHPSSSSFHPPIPPPHPPSPNLPALQAVVRRARDFFGTKIAVLTIVREDGPAVLVTMGVPEEIEKEMRGTHYCSTAVLSNGEEFVVLNPHEDWRFENNVLASGLDARFYAGAPLFSQTSFDVYGNPKAIGTLCIVDDKPHASFSYTKRAQLRDMAAQASADIYFASHASKPALSLPTPPLSPITHGPSSFPPPPSSFPPPPPRSLRTSSLDPLSPSLQKIFDVVTRGLAHRLSLDLVYLVSLRPSLALLSRYSTDEAPEGFNTALHEEVMSAIGGGVRYLNPCAGEGEYASGLLVPVGELVLGGFTKSEGRELGEKELSLFERVTEGLRRYIVV